MRATTTVLAGAMIGAIGCVACATPIEIPLADSAGAWSADAGPHKDPSPAPSKDGGAGAGDRYAGADQPPPGAPDAGSPSMQDGDGDCCVAGAGDAAMSDADGPVGDGGEDAAHSDGGDDDGGVADALTADASEDAETTIDDAAGDLP